jgi:hypothetical protein
VRQTNPWPTQLVHVIGIQTPKPKASRNRRAQGYPPRLVSTNPTRATPPTHVTELVEHPPAYQGFVDASKWGVGGVWFGGTKQLIPIVWFYEWPQTIMNQFCSASNKTGSLTILDLELTGILLQWLVLEHLVDTSTLRDASVSIWCNNLPAVAWMYKFQTSTSLVAARILRALAVRLHTNRAALLSVE